MEKESSIVEKIVMFFCVPYLVVFVFLAGLFVVNNYRHRDDEDDVKLIPIEAVEVSNEEKNGALVLDCISEGLNFHIELPAIFEKVLEPPPEGLVGIRFPGTVGALTEGERLYVVFAVNPSAKRQIILPDYIPGLAGTNGGDYYISSDRKEQTINGHKCIWYKEKLSTKEKEIAVISGNINSEDEKNGIAIMLFTKDEDDADIIDDTWRDIIAGVEF